MNAITTAEPPAPVAIDSARATTRRMLNTAANVCAVAGIGGDEFDELLLEGREVFRSRVRQLVSARDGS